MKLWVLPTIEQANRGFLRSVCDCPIAMAIQEATGGHWGTVLVTPREAIFCEYGKPDVHVALPRAVVEWIHAFDNCDLASQPPLEAPPRFMIEVPDCVVREARKCLKCRRHMVDLRDSGFATSAIDKDGICFQWANDTFACNAWAARN